MAEKLESFGVESVADLKDVDTDELAGEVDGVEVDTVRDWQAKVD